MDRRSFLVTGVALAALGATGARAETAAARTAEDARLRDLLDGFWQADLDESPQLATSQRLDVGARAGQRFLLNDTSREARARSLAARKERLAALATVKEEALSEAARVDLDVIRYQYETAVAAAENFTYGAPGYSPYTISQRNGPYQSLPDFLDATHPVTNRDDAEAYLSRLSAMKGVLDQSTADFLADAARGVLAPSFTLDTSLRQYDALLTDSPAEHSLTQSLVRRAAAARIEGDWAARAASIVEKDVLPAIARQRAAVAEQRRTATEDAGVWKLPDGEAYYAGSLAFHTTTRMTPEEVYQLGLNQVRSLTSELDQMLRTQGLTQGSVGERLTALAARPGQIFPATDEGREALLTLLREQAEAMRKRMPEVFATIPPAPLEVLRVPPAIEAGSAGAYAQAPSPDGSRPGRYYINLQDTVDRPRFSLATLTYHEAIPGHVWQGAIAIGSDDIPMVRRSGGGFAAYSEGWALYAEQLADEMGVYEDNPLERIGYLQSLLFRAVRLVVDTGLHTRRWSREQAITTMAEGIGTTRTRALREIDRYCVTPGQACSYKIGHNEWVRLREKARQRAGDRFSLKAFHDVLKAGRMPLVVLERVVDSRVWA